MPQHPRHPKLAELLEPALGKEATVALVDAIPTLDHVNARFDQIDAHLGDHDRRFEQIDRRFEQIDHRFELLEVSMQSLSHELVAVFRGELRDAVTAQTRIAVYGMIGVMISFLGVLLMVR